MTENVYIKCQKCGTQNHNRDYCENCGAIINTLLKRELEREKRENLKQEKAQTGKAPSKIELFFNRARSHPNYFIRSPAKILYSLWWLVMIIGGVFAYIATVIAA